MHTRVRATLAVAVVATVMIAVAPTAGSAAPVRPKETRVSAEYQVVGPESFDDVNAIAATGAAVNGVEHGRVLITATADEVRDIRALGFEVNEIPQPAPIGGPVTKAFPANDSGYHDYAEMVAEIDALVASKPAIAQKLSIGTSYQGRDMPSPGTTVYSDDFETATGWTTNPNGTDTATTGLWERGVPQATSSSGPKQLSTTVSGTNDLVTGRLAGSSAGTHDIDGGVTSVRSPAITLPSSGTLTLSLSYYLAHGSNSSSADFFRVSVVHDGGTTQVFNGDGAASDVDASWAVATADLSAYAGQSIRILIQAADASGASLVEAAVDNVTVTQT